MNSIHNNQLKLCFNKFKRNKSIFISLFFIIILAACCVFIPLFSVYEYSKTDFTSQLQAPSMQHFFGTDSLGRDIFVRCFMGGRITFEVAIIATCVVLSIGVVYGTVSGFFGGKVDAFMMRIIDVLYGIPFLFFSILLLTLFGQSIILSFIAIASISWLDMARVTRGQTLSIKQKEFIEASYVVGVRRIKIIARHIVPNLFGVIVVYAAMVIPNMIILSAVLSFFGLGVVEPMTSWGLLISDGSKNVEYWWLLFFPVILMTSTLLAFAFLSNGLRDALDKKSR